MHFICAPQKVSRSSIGMRTSGPETCPGPTACLCKGYMMRTLVAPRKHPFSTLLEPFEFTARHRTILYTTTLVEIRATYAGSVFGAIWLMLGPLLMLGVYAMTYAVIFRVRPADMTVTEYVLYVFCGIV